MRALARVSGFVALVNVDRAPADPGLLDGMTAALAFRGPDGSAVWTDGHVGLGHTLLRTTDESARETQPCTLDGEVWIAADARIDGRRELIRRLRGRGRAVGARTPRTRSSSFTPTWPGATPASTS